MTNGSPCKYITVHTVYKAESYGHVFVGGRILYILKKECTGKSML